jgi:hypothetical protein
MARDSGHCSIRSRSLDRRVAAYQESPERRLDPDGGGGEDGRGAALAGEPHDGDGRLGRGDRRVRRRRGGRGHGDGVLALLPLPLPVRLGVGRGPEPRGLGRARDRRVAAGAGRDGRLGRGGGLRGVPGGLAEAPPLGAGRRGRRLLVLPLPPLVLGWLLLAQEAAEPPRRLAHRRTWGAGGRWWSERRHE